MRGIRSSWPVYKDGDPPPLRVEGNWGWADLGLALSKLTRKGLPKISKLMVDSPPPAMQGILEAITYHKKFIGWD